MGISLLTAPSHAERSGSKAFLRTHPSPLSDLRKKQIGSGEQMVQSSGTGEETREVSPRRWRVRGTERRTYWPELSTGMYRGSCRSPVLCIPTALFIGKYSKWKPDSTSKNSWIYWVSTWSPTAEVWQRYVNTSSYLQKAACQATGGKPRRALRVFTLALRKNKAKPNKNKEDRAGQGRATTASSAAGNSPLCPPRAAAPLRSAPCRAARRRSLPRSAGRPGPAGLGAAGPRNPPQEPRMPVRGSRLPRRLAPRSPSGRQKNWGARGSSSTLFWEDRVVARPPPTRSEKTLLWGSRVFLSNSQGKEKCIARRSREVERTRLGTAPATRD